MEHNLDNEASDKGNFDGVSQLKQEPEEVPDHLKLPSEPLAFDKLAVESSNFIWTTRIFKVVEKSMHEFFSNRDLDHQIGDNEYDQYNNDRKATLANDG